MKTFEETAAWQQYEAGRSYKRRIGLYETVRTNERFYRGIQWQGTENSELPHPVFNIVRRIADYLICNVASDDLRVTYTDENLPYISDKRTAELISVGVDAFNRDARTRMSTVTMKTASVQEKPSATPLRTITITARCSWAPSKPQHTATEAQRLQSSASATTLTAKSLP